ncbi:hypothetical protein [Jatrophihabitans sp.]|uniref:hypothetical protein n=1 Tax=Jatrophihabitans sp. TaxID=1932789 RepID=UPI002BC82F97|nr:hypothetical protein [Jatrophihabitans sp.]
MSSEENDPVAADEVAHAELASVKQQLAEGFRSAGRAGLAEAVTGADFGLWVQTESGWNPRVVSGRTNQGMVNGGLFQFWYGHTWAQRYFSRGNDPRSVFTMPPADQARAVVRHFPHVTAATVHRYAQQIRNGSYSGWG